MSKPGKNKLKKTLKISATDLLNYRNLSYFGI